jgi:metal-responsive CopG/Arc/MetJ family transcriptional regulator
MSISIRLPEDLEQKLEKEVRISRRNRSDVVREAVGEYLTRREKERLIEEMKAAARVLYSDPEVVRHEQQIQADFDAVDDSLKQIEAEERAVGEDRDEPWWE